VLLDTSPLIITLRELDPIRFHQVRRTPARNLFQTLQVHV
jgi:hypothetical protein